MSTSRVTLDTSQYVRVNVGYLAMVLQAHRDSVRIVLNETKPAKSNTAYMMLGGDAAPLNLEIVDTNVWALAVSARSSLIVTEASHPLKTIAGLNDMGADVWGRQLMTQPWSLVEGTFTFSLAARKWLIYYGDPDVEANEQAFDTNNPLTHVRSTSGAAHLTADATHPWVVLQSRECPKYQGNRGHHFATAILCPLPAADGIREWGLKIDGDGAFFRLKPTGLYAVLRSGGVDVREELIDTSRISGWAADQRHVYDVRHHYRGMGNYYFYIDLTEVHVFTELGTTPTPPDVLTMENPALPMHFSCERVTEDVEMYSGCGDITSEGGRQAPEQYNAAYAENVTTTVAASDDPVIVISVPFNIGAKINTRTVSLDRITVTCDKTATFKVWLTRNPAAFTGGLFQKIPDSYLECDSPDTVVGAVRVTAVNTALCRFITAIPVQAGIRTPIITPDPDRIHFPIIRGDYIVVTCAANVGNADAVIEIGEQI